ncbi:AAA family ATPase, partial [Elusimicrobiota bacterium]
MRSLIEKEQRDRYKNASELIDNLSKLVGIKITEETLEQRKSYLYCSKLIGRKQELDYLKSCLNLALEKKGGSTIFIGAPAGVGKSRLIQEFRLEVQLKNVLFVTGICSEQDTSAYAPMKGALKTLIPQMKSASLDKYGQVLVKIIPALEAKGYSPAPLLHGDAEKIRLHEVVTACLREIAEVAPLVLCIEDLHSADASSIALLNTCIRELGETNILFINTLRDNELEEQPMVYQTLEEELSHLIKMSPLNKDDTIAMIKSMMGQVELTEEFNAQIFKVTEGNPFFVTEIMRSLIEKEQIRLEHGYWMLSEDIEQLELPASIEDTVAHRLSFLSAEALKCARTAAVFGRKYDFPFLQSFSGIGTDQLFYIIDELIEHQFIVKDKKNYFFSHDRVMETLYSQIDESERKHIHEITGNYLEEKYGDNIKYAAGMLAYHFYRGLNKQKAVKYLLMSAEKSLSISSHIEATEAYMKAIPILEEIEYPDKEWTLLNTFHNTIESCYVSNPEYCIEICEKLLEILHRLVGGKQKLFRMIGMFKIAFKIINLLPEKFSSWIKVKLNESHTLPEKENYCKVMPDMNYILTEIIVTYAFMSNAYSLLGEHKKCISIIEYTINNYLPETEHSIFVAAVILGKQGALTDLGQQNMVIANIKEQIDIFTTYPAKLDRMQYFMLTTAYFYCNVALSESGKRINEEYFREGLKICEEIDEYHIRSWHWYAKCNSACLRGKHAELEAMIDVASDISKKMGRPGFIESNLNAVLSFNSLQKGEFKLAQKLAEKSEKLFSKNVAIGCYTGIFLETTLGKALFKQGKTDEALSHMLEIVATAQMNDIGALPIALCTLSEIYMEMDKLEKATETVEKAYERASSEKNLNPYHQIICHSVMARINLLRKDPEQVLKHLEAGIRIAFEDDNSIQEGLLHVLYAKLYITLEQYNTAKEHLIMASKRFTDIKNDYQLKKVNILLDDLKCDL